jgi:hypothetical protein
MRDIEIRFAHLGWRRTAPRRANHAALQAQIAEIQAEQEAKNVELHKVDLGHIPLLRVAERYAAGRPMTPRRRQLEGD